MKRMGLMLSLTLIMGIVLGMIGGQVLNAQQEPLKRTALLTADLAGMPGKEVYMGITEFAPGAASGKHYHPGNEFLYVLEGTLTSEDAGKAPVTYKAGQVFHRSPKMVHEGKNLTTAPVRSLVFHVGEKGQPRVVPVK